MEALHLRFGRISFPLLEAFIFMGSSYWLKKTIPIEALKKAPRLRTIRFNQLPEWHCGPLAAFPFYQVTTVVIENMVFSTDGSRSNDLVPHLKKWLPKVDRLKCLEIRRMVFLLGKYNPDLGQHLVLPDLERLLLCCHSGDEPRYNSNELPRLLSSFTAPRLTAVDLSVCIFTMQIRRDHISPMWSLLICIVEFLSLVQRSKCVLTSLSLDCARFWITIKEVAEVFRSTPNLEHLTPSLRYRRNGFLNDICRSAFSSDDEPLFPNLAHLTLQCHNSNKFPVYSVLVPFLERQREQSRLRSFTFSRNRGVDLVPQLRVRMKGLSDAGMDIYLIDPHDEVRWVPESEGGLRADSAENLKPRELWKF